METVTDRAARVDQRFALQPEAVRVGADPRLAVPFEAICFADSTFELIEQAVNKDASILDGFAERRGDVRISARGLCRCHARQDEDTRGGDGRHPTGAHATTTVRNMLICWWKSR
jgi:hypothetical protein